MHEDAPDRTIGPGVTRRALFGTGAATGALMLTAAGPPGSAEDGGPWLIGTLSTHAGDGMFTVSPVAHPERRVLVKLDVGATLLRDGPASLSDFGPGEEIGIGGRWEGETYLASTVESTYRLVDAEVTTRRGAVLVTTDGAVELITTTTAREGQAPDGGAMLGKSIETIAPGDHIVVLGRRDPDTGRLWAGHIGVRPEP
jgi:hypothetical protein